MRRLLTLALVVWLLGEWYMRGGREFLFGESVHESWEPELQTIRKWAVVAPPSIRHTFTDEAARSLVGRTFPGRDGDLLGTVLAAERDKRGWLNVHYEADRLQLGFPITVAVATAEFHLARELAKVAHLI